MRVLLVCAGGCSTSILMKKLEKYAHEVRGIEDFTIAAKGTNSVRKEMIDNWDCILMGPQVGYLKEQVAERANHKIPVEVMNPADYGIGNCANIFKLIDKCLAASEA